MNIKTITLLLITLLVCACAGPTEAEKKQINLSEYGQPVISYISKTKVPGICKFDATYWQPDRNIAQSLIIFDSCNKYSIGDTIIFNKKARK